MTRTATKAPDDEPATDTSDATDYETDFFAWTQEQARLLRDARFSALDFQNIAEELDDLGRSQKREIRSRLVVILLHLLKWQCQPSRRSGSWRSTLISQRDDLRSELDDSPSLRSYPALQLDKAYAVARAKAAAETKLALPAFPEACPFTIEEILDQDFLPDAAAA